MWATTCLDILPAAQIIDNAWDVPAVANSARDLKEKVIGTIGGGRIGWEAMRRLKVPSAKLELNALHLAATASCCHCIFLSTVVLTRHISFTFLLQSFDCKLMYFDREEKSHFKDIGCEYKKDMVDLLGQCDVVTINVPLTNSTR